MSLLFRIIYAAHARGTHHKLALDSLRNLAGPDAEGWRRLFLKHAEVYLEGAKAPDKEFKDFKNHVLHVRDGYWGGAMDKVEAWYGRLVEELRAERWSEAVYCAGILSHYYTDPIHPFHTAQSEVENDIHRAVEWSISKSYGDLRRIGLRTGAIPEITIAHGDHWPRDIVCQGADLSNAQYERLIAHYDIEKGVVDPPAGLDPIARGVIGQLLVYAANGFALILDRAFAEAGKGPPAVNLTAETVIAGLKIPAKWLTRRLEDAEDRALVQRMYDELTRTGHVEENLPEDDRAVRDLHAVEVLASQADALARQRAEALSRGRRRMAAAPKSPQPAPRLSPESAKQVTERSPGPIGPAAVPVVAGENSRPNAGAPLASVPVIGAASGGRRPRVYLAASDDLEAAPSIGPKTAARLDTVGLRTVADLMSADPRALAGALGVGHITADTITAWQQQARLVMTVPGLRGTHAQLLTGAGYTDADKIAAADPAAVAAGVLAFASTPDGQRLLREGAAPDLEVIKSWCEAARMSVAA